VVWSIILDKDFYGRPGKQLRGFYKEVEINKKDVESI